MTRGRKPLPTALKKLKGNPGNRPLNQSEPEPEVCIPDPPEVLSEDARIEWDRLATELDDLGLLTAIDMALLALYCQAFGDWKDARRQIEATGMVVRAPSGYPMVNPYVTIANKAIEQMRTLATEFGMTPASRSRISVQPKRQTPNRFAALEMDPAEKYFQSRYP